MKKFKCSVCFIYLLMLLIVNGCSLFNEKKQMYFVKTLEDGREEYLTDFKLTDKFQVTYSQKKPINAVSFEIWISESDEKNEKTKSPYRKYIRDIQPDWPGFVFPAEPEKLELFIICVDGYYAYMLPKSKYLQISVIANGKLLAKKNLHWTAE